MNVLVVNINMNMKKNIKKKIYKYLDKDIYIKNYNNFIYYSWNYYIRIIYKIFM